MSTPPDRQTPSSSSAGDVVAQARAKMEESIINVNQFFPEITGGIRVYNDKFCFLADNRPDIPEEEEEEEKGEEKEEEQEEEKGGRTGEEEEGKGERTEEEEEKEKTNVKIQETEKTEEEDVVENENRSEISYKEERVEDEAAKEIEGRKIEEKDEDGSESREKSADSSGVFATEVGTGSPSSQEGATNLVFLPEHWSSRGRDLSALRGVIADSTAEHYKAGQVAAKLARFDTALAHFNKCVQLGPHEAVYYVRRAEILLSLCDFASAILNYKRACILQPSNRQLFQRLAFLYLLHGQSLFDQKLYPEALEHFSRAAEMMPDRVAYQTRNLACLAALQRHGECLALVNKRLEADSGSADLYVMRARLHGMFRNYSLCYYDLKDALSLDASHGPALAMLTDLAEKAQLANARAVELALSGRTREALGRVSLAIEMDPTVASFHVKRGAFQRRLGDFNAAIDDLLLALDKADHDESSPVFAEAQRQLLLTFNDFAVECFAKGYYEEAIVLLNKAIKAEKREGGLYINRGDCFYRQGEFGFALADFHQALELQTDASTATVHARIALVHHRAGQDAFALHKDLVGAEERFSQAIRHNPSVPHFWMARARVRYAADRASDGARRDVVAALLLQPGEQDAEDGSMSLVSRLFPGHTLSEVVGSAVGAAAREELQREVRHLFPAAEVAVGEPRLQQQHGRVRRGRRKAAAKSKAVPSLRECVSERALYAELVEEKRSLAAEVKQRQRQRQSLKATTGRVLPMNAPSDLVRRGAVGREVLLNEKGEVVAREGEGQGWRQFACGMSACK